VLVNIKSDLFTVLFSLNTTIYSLFKKQCYEMSGVAVIWSERNPSHSLPSWPDHEDHRSILRSHDVRKFSLVHVTEKVRLDWLLFSLKKADLDGGTKVFGNV
jgi:hypothetical protein